MDLILDLEKKAELFFNKENHKEALNIYLKLLILYKQEQNKAKIAFIEKRLSKIYFYLCDYTSSIKHTLEALVIYKELNDIQNISLCYHYLGISYLQRDERDKSLAYFYRALEGFLLTDSYVDISRVYNAFGVIYIETQEIDKAYENLVKSLDYAIKSNDIETISTATSNLGLVNLEKQNYDEALSYFYKALKFDEDLGIKRGISDTYQKISETLMNKGNFNLALEMANSSLNIATEIENTYLISCAYILISVIYEKMELYKESLEYHKKHLEKVKQMYTEDNNKRVAELQKSHEIKEKEIYMQKNEELKTLNAKLTDAYEDIKRLSLTDPLTGLLNRRGFIEKTKDLEYRCLLNNYQFAILAFDLDDFKKINDTYGHPAGDAVLIEISRIIKERFYSKVSESEGIIGRLGGEEFIVFLFNRSIDDVVQIAEDIRLAICNYNLKFGPHYIHVTSTIGISCSNNLDINSQFEIADKNLYIGKNSQKNCVVY